MNATRNIILIFLFFGLILLIRLFSLQVIDDSYKRAAERNAFRYDVEYPARGLIYDRNGKAIVENITTYDIMISPREIKNFDTTELSEVFEISVDETKAILRKLDKKLESQPFLRQISSESYAKYREKAYRFPGFYPIVRTLRVYPRSVGGNVLGYIQEVDNKIINNNPYYKSGDYIGKSGIEEYYEEVLRGRKGVSIYLRDSKNQVKGSYMNGIYDTAAIPGHDLTSSIDVDLQEYAQLLLENKIGSVVAIEPNTGEILALVSSPTFDPKLMSGPDRQKNYLNLQRDPYKPLFNRAIMSSQNPPGSVFKMVNGMIGLEEGVLTPHTRYPCSGGYPYGRGVKCHGHFSPTDLSQSIQVSCNAYYCYVFRNIIDNKKYPNLDSSLIAWRRHVQQLGFGRKLGVDMPSEQGGVLPTPARYDRDYGKGGWKSISIISLSIGQGEIGATTLQLANLAAIIANRGYYYPPHIVKGISGGNELDSIYSQRQYVGIDSTFFPPIVEGMYMAVNGAGTAWRVRIPDIDLCGKTGTAQNPHGKDNSVFICFAPKDKPKIALAVYVEHGGWGATYAPIAALMVEKYLKKEVTRKDLEASMLSNDLIHKRE